VPSSFQGQATCLFSYNLMKTSPNLQNCELFAGSPK
jgi:hypothetical protein